MFTAQQTAYDRMADKGGKKSLPPQQTAYDRLADKGGKTTPRKQIVRSNTDNLSHKEGTPSSSRTGSFSQTPQKETTPTKASNDLTSV